MTSRTRRVLFAGLAVGMIGILGGGWWFWLRPPIGARMAWRMRPAASAISATAIRHELQRSLVTPPHTVATLSQHLDAWGVLAGVAAVSPTNPAANKPLPATVPAALKRQDWPGHVPRTPEQASIALGSLANTLTVVSTLQWVQSRLPATGSMVAVTPADYRLWGQWRHLPTAPVAALPSLQALLVTIDHQWQHGSVSLASVELAVVIAQQIESNEAALNGAVVPGLAQAAAWRQVGLALPAQWHRNAQLAPSVTHATTLSRSVALPFAVSHGPSLAMTGEHTWTVTAQPNTAMALTVLALNQVSKLLVTALSVQHLVTTLPDLVTHAAQLPHDLGLLAVNMTAILQAGDSRSTHTVLMVAESTWMDLRAWQSVLSAPQTINHQVGSLTDNMVTTAQALMQGQSAFPLYTVWNSHRFGSLAGTAVHHGTARLTTDLPSAFPHSQLWVEGSPYVPYHAGLTTLPTGTHTIHAVLQFPTNVLWWSIGLDVSRFVNPLVSALLRANTGDTLGLSLLVSFVVHPLINHFVVGSLQSQVNTLEQRIPAVPVAGPNPWILPAFVQNALHPQGAWAETVWPVAPSHPEALVAYFDPRLQAENLAILSASGRVLWRYAWHTMPALKTFSDYNPLNDSTLRTWWLPSEHEAVVATTTGGLNHTNQVAWLLRWVPGHLTPSVHIINGMATPSTPTLSTALSRLSGFTTGAAQVQVGSNGTVYVESLNSLAGMPGTFHITPLAGVQWRASHNSLRVGITSHYSGPSADTPVTFPGTPSTVLAYRTARRTGRALTLLPSQGHTLSIPIWTNSALRGLAGSVTPHPAPSAFQAAALWWHALVHHQNRQAWALMTPAFRQNPGISGGGAGSTSNWGGWGSLRRMTSSTPAIFHEITKTSQTTRWENFSRWHASPYRANMYEWVGRMLGANSGQPTITTLTIQCVHTPQGWLVNDFSYGFSFVP